jgi:hypothetical protein
MQLTQTTIIGILALVSLITGYILNITGAWSKFKCWALERLANALLPYHKVNCPAAKLEVRIQKIEENQQWSNDVLAILLGNTLKWDSDKAIAEGFVTAEKKNYIIKRYYPYWLKNYNGEVAIAVLTCINLPPEKGGQHTNFTFEDIYGERV